MLTNAEQTEIADLILKWNATDILPEQETRLAELERKRDESRLTESARTHKDEK